MASKEQIAQGVVKYIRADVLPSIQDKTFRTILSAGTYLVEAQPEMIDKIMEHPIISVMIPKAGSGYDIAKAEQAVRKALEENGGIEIVIPGIKWISPDEKVLKFTAADITALRNYIGG
ncbi:MAG: hypothetical protein IJX47_02930 [Clostridia bacterium]|nr:hypothetical protein [Clostridia bacterium]